MEKYIERMCDESKELSEQISSIVERKDRLNYFIESNFNIPDLTNDQECMEQEWMMRHQLEEMTQAIKNLSNYRDILDKRIASEILKKK